MTTSADLPCGLPREFDPTHPVPGGTVLLEASAGTGKTHTLTSLVLRLVAEDGIDLDRVLVVTFTRAAAAELRGRIRGRLATAVTAFDRAISEGWSSEEAGELTDPVIRQLLLAALDAGDTGCIQRHRRLITASERFDDATIDTIHGFCQRALQRAAPDIDLELGATLSEDVEHLIEELVQDALVTELRGADPDWYRFLAAQKIGAARLHSIARAVEAEPDLDVLPEHPDLDDVSPHHYWERCLTRFRTAWEAEGDELVGWLQEHGREAFDGRLYSGKRPGKEGQRLTEWCARAPAAVGDLTGIETCLAYVARSQLEQKVHDPAVLPNHLQVIDAAQALLEAPAYLGTQVLRRFARHARTELPARKAARGILSFSDLLVELDRALASKAARDAVRAGIRSRFDVALIDEFQDTDAVQWRIFDRLFGTDARLQLIGDPKQAIYAFRGADIRTYLHAKRQVPPDRRFTLSVNHRCDHRYLQALQELFGRDLAFEPDGIFAVDGIAHVPVSAAPHHVDDRLRFDTGPRPTLELRYVGRSLQAGSQEPADPSKPISSVWAVPFLARTVAQEIVGFLEEAATIDPPHGDPRRVAPRDVAVLVRTNDQARRVQDALQDVGVPAVVASDGSVLATPEALALQRLLDALLRPSSDRLVRAALVGPILGRPAAELAGGDDDAWVGWLERFDRWVDLWRHRGVAALLRQVLAEARTAPRLLGQPRGERTLTNLLHLAELLHGAEAAGRLGPEGVAAWLREQRHAGDDEPAGEDDRELRLESDADAVTVVTVHRAKGLQYPVVWCPFLWRGNLLFGDDAKVLRLHDPDTGRLSLDVDTDVEGPTKARRLAFAQRERWEENLRLMYVALTRAQHRCVVHTGPFRGVGTSPLQRLLHGADCSEQDGVPVLPSDPDGVPDQALLDELLALASDHVGVSEVGPVDPGVHWSPPEPDRAPLTVRRLERDLDRSWQRTSFSRLVAGAALDDARAASESPPDEGRDHDDEVEDHEVDGGILGVQGEQAGITLADFPRGPGPGTFLHAVLEHLDFRDAGDPQAIGAVVDEQQRRTGWEPPRNPATRRTLLRGLQEVVTTPLGPAFQDRSLSSIARDDRLDELDFDLPLAGGYRAGGVVTLHRVAEVLAAHAPNSAAPLAAFARRLRQYPVVDTRGFLTGSIDLVARIDGRYLIADYKSNWLGSGGQPPRSSVIGDYHPRRLATEMVGHDYVLQYHLYLVALHRFLRWRLPGYDYDRDVAGAAYLFLRGMLGPQTPRTDTGMPYGVYVDRPTPELIEDLDAVLRGTGA